jgi:thiopurine S-methyltransferase
LAVEADMEWAFWQARWEKRQTRWQVGATNNLLRRNSAALALPQGTRVLVRRNFARSRLAYGVCGAELSRLAIRQRFAGLGLTPEIPATGQIQRHSAPGIDIFQGDVLDLTPDILGQVDGIHDRASMTGLTCSPCRLICSDFQGRISSA